MFTNVNELDRHRRTIIGNILYKIDLGRSNILPLSTYKVVIVNRRTIVMDITNSQLLKFCAPQQQMLGLNMEISTEA